jgi:hypothetical protein
MLIKEKANSFHTVASATLNLFKKVKPQNTIICAAVAMN